MRSYSSGRSKIGVFINNSIVKKERRQREEAKEEKRLEQEEMRFNKRKEKEEQEIAKLARKALEKEIEKQEKEQEKAQKQKEKMAKKVQKVYDRLETDMEKLGLYANENFLYETSTEAIKRSVTAAQAKAYFISDKNDKKLEENISVTCARNFLDDNYIGIGHKNLPEYSELVKFVANYRPQNEVPNDSKYNTLLEELNLKIKIDEDMKAEKKALKEEQLALIDELTKNQIMFKEDIHDFWDIMEKNNWDRNQATTSKEYKQKKKNRTEYVAKIRNQIKPIRLHN